MTSPAPEATPEAAQATARPEGANGHASRHAPAAPQRSQAEHRPRRRARIDEVAIPAWKRTFDVIAAAFGLLLLMPAFALISLAIVLESRGGPIYRHARVGRGGRTFVCWKFRSMHDDAEQQLERLRERNEANGHIFKMRDDPRRSRVGAVLRKTGLDEFPQLWNVLRGEMSLVGPRPPLPSEVAEYAPEHLQRLAGVPGITGLWQVTARERYDFEEMVRLDVEYLSSMRPWRDARIVLATIPAMLFARGS
jgi:lipopolysaccharide/colanic/teichoic acid biosynthesis glycosyltransferase